MKRMLHQDRGKTESPEMDWDYYGDQNQIIGQPQHVRGAQSLRERKEDREKANTEEGLLPHL